MRACQAVRFSYWSVIGSVGTIPAMNDAKSSQFAVWLAVIAILLVASTAYTGAYFGLSTKTTKNNVSGGKCRVYCSAWVAVCFIPASLVETAVSGGRVSPAWPSP